MKKVIIIILGWIVLGSGCKETIIQYAVPKELVNDAFHGDIVGKIIQKNSNAVALVSQVNVIDSVQINPNDGSFAFRALQIGNYDLTIRSATYRLYSKSNVLVNGGGITYVGEIDLSTVPEHVNETYPKDRDEIVYDWRYGRITISILFGRPMDRASVEKAFSTNPPSTGIFYWGNYTRAPMTELYAITADGARFEPGATITTFSKVTSMTYQMSKKDSFTDTLYTVTLSTGAKDTSGNHLRFPLVFSFRTVQSYVTVYGIQTNPVHGDINIEPFQYSNGITVTFPRRMDPTTTEAALQITPQLNKAVLWPKGNVMRIWPGGPLPSDTTITVTIDGSALDKDGIPLAEAFSFWFRTAPFAIRYTSPANAQLYVPRGDPITLLFNNYVNKTSVQTAFSISPSASGSIDYVRDNQGREYLDQIVFKPSSQLQPSTKYTVTISATAANLDGVTMKAPLTFSFITRQ